MAFVKLGSLNGDIELILFPSVLQQTIDLWKPDAIVIVKGKVNSRDRDGNEQTELKVLVDEARLVTLEQAQAYQATGKTMKLPGEKGASSGQFTKRPGQAGAAPKASSAAIPKRVYIRLPSTEDQDQLRRLKDVVDAQQAGEDEVVLIVGTGEAKQAIRLPQKVSGNDELKKDLQTIFGDDNVRIQ